MRIGMTGATGFIGRYYLREYAGKHELRIASSDPRRLEKTDIGNGTVFETDYSVDSFLKSFEGCDAVVHLGSRVSDRVSGFGNMADYLQSIESSDNLFQAAAELKIRKVVDISSVAVYEKKASPLREEDAYRPTNAYGIAKAAVEIMGEGYSRNYGFDFVSLRVSLYSEKFDCLHKIVMSQKGYNNYSLARMFAKNLL